MHLVQSLYETYGSAPSGWAAEAEKEVALHWRFAPRALGQQWRRSLGGFRSGTSAELAVGTLAIMLLLFGVGALFVEHIGAILGGATGHGNFAVVGYLAARAVLPVLLALVLLPAMTPLAPVAGAAGAAGRRPPSAWQLGAPPPPLSVVPSMSSAAWVTTLCYALLRLFVHADTLHLRASGWPARDPLVGPAVRSVCSLLGLQLDPATLAMLDLGQGALFGRFSYWRLLLGIVVDLLPSWLFFYVAQVRLGASCAR